MRERFDALDAVHRADGQAVVLSESSGDCRGEDFLIGPTEQVAEQNLKDLLGHFVGVNVAPTQIFHPGGARQVLHE